MTELGAKRAMMPSKSLDFESGVPLIVVTTSPASIPAAAAGPLGFGVSKIALGAYEAKAFGDRFGHRTYANAGPTALCRFTRFPRCCFGASHLRCQET